MVVTVETVDEGEVVGILVEMELKVVVSVSEVLTVVGTDRVLLWIVVRTEVTGVLKGGLAVLFLTTLVVMGVDVGKEVVTGVLDVLDVLLKVLMGVLLDVLLKVLLGVLLEVLVTITLLEELKTRELLGVKLETTEELGIELDFTTLELKLELVEGLTLVVKGFELEMVLELEGTELERMEWEELEGA